MKTDASKLVLGELFEEFRFLKIVYGHFTYLWGSGAQWLAPAPFTSESWVRFSVRTLRISHVQRVCQGPWKSYKVVFSAVEKQTSLRHVQLLPFLEYKNDTLGDFAVTKY